MKFTKLLFMYLALLIPSILGNPPTKYSYKTSGDGAYASVEWYEDGCPSWSWFYVAVSETAERVKENKKPQELNGLYLYLGLQLFSDCSDGTATMTSLWIYPWEDQIVDVDFSVNKKVTKASFSGEFEGEVLTVTVSQCCYSWNMTEYCYPCGYEYGEVTPVDITLDVNWVGTGVPSVSSGQYHYRFPGGSYRGKYSGKSNDATATPALVIGGESFPVPLSGDSLYSYAAIYKNKESYVDIYKN
jgi:hypothetical protein